MSESFMLFLGTGGGRYVTYRQARATGGIYVSMDGARFVIDPGPGSLAHLRKLRLKDPSGILLSHYHLDHSNDANALLDGMKNPFLLAEEHCISGDENNYPCIGKYHQAKVSFLMPMKAGDRAEIPETSIVVKATESRHTAPGIGFVIEGSAKIGYTSDTVYFDGIGKPFEGCDFLLMNVLVPSRKVPLENKHMGIDQAISMIDCMKEKPGMIVLQHFSFWMLQNSVSLQAKLLEKATGVKTIAAKDFQKIDMAKGSGNGQGLGRFTKR